MKNPDRKRVSRLEDLPNIGKAMAGNLRLIGIQHPQDIIGKNPFLLYSDLCKIADKKGYIRLSQIASTS